MSTLTALPSAIRAGTTVKYQRSLADYPASAWTLKLTLAGKSVLTVTAGEDGDTFEVTLTAAETATLAAGRYQWIERIENAGATEKYDVASGSLNVLLNLATAAAGDARSKNEILLEALDAALLGKATADQLAIQVHNRSIQRYSLAEIAKLRNQVYVAVLKERSGGKPYQTHLVRFRGP